MADLHLLRTLLVICQQTQEPSFWEVIDSFYLFAIPKAKFFRKENNTIIQMKILNGFLIIAEHIPKRTKNVQKSPAERETQDIFRFRPHKTNITKLYAKNHDKIQSYWQHGETPKKDLSKTKKAPRSRQNTILFFILKLPE